MTTSLAFIQLGVRTGMDTVGVEENVGGKKFIYTPQIMLHADATAEDTFRSLVVLHRVVHEMQGHTKIKSADTDASGSDDEKIDNVSEVVEPVELAYRYYKENIFSITEKLTRANWDISRFTFGSIGKRIEPLSR